MAQSAGARRVITVPAEHENPRAVDVADLGTSQPRFLRNLVRQRIATACIVYLIGLVVVAVVATKLFPDVETQFAGDLTAARQLPSLHHLLGTDSLGRDVLERLLVGTQVSLIGVLEGLSVALALGVPFGLAAGYFGGWLDRVVNWLAELSFSMPALIIILLVLSVFPPVLLTATVTLGILVAPAIMRVVRSATLPVRQELYIAAARVAGLSHAYILTRHVLPRIAGVVIVQASLLAATLLLVEQGLAYLGLLNTAPAPSWGGMVNEGIQAILLDPWLIWPPGGTIAVTVLAFALLGDSIRDATAQAWSTPIMRRAARRTRPTPTIPIVGSDRPQLLVVEGLTVSFPSERGAVRVVEDVTFEIQHGETVGLVGESGCGKTVTAMSILGLLPGTGQIECGRIMFEGRDLVPLAGRDLLRIRGKQVGLVSQEPMASLNPVFTIGWQLADMVHLHHGLSRRAARKRAIELLHDVHLPEAEIVAQRYPFELSGGMAQRVAIARALAGEPKLLIADEPTTALDVTVQSEILTLLRDLQHERKMAILLVTHDWGVVADLCDRVVVMYAGQVVERGSVGPIFRQPRHPYTQALMASNPYHAPAAKVLPTIPGDVPRPGAWDRGCHFRPRCGYATEECAAGPIALDVLSAGRETRCIHNDQLQGLVSPPLSGSEPVDLRSRPR
jgi:peptide/nickel transport system permease protein